MHSALRASLLRLTIAAFAALTVLLVVAASANAINVKLRVEGSTTTHFNGAVTTGPRGVPGGTDSEACHANATPNTFTEPNGLTAITDALGEPAVSTSGTFYGWGVLLCSAAGEAVPDSLAGWLIRINNRNVSAPGGFVTATTPLAEGDSVLFYMSPEYTTFSSSLDLKLPANAAPGQPVTALVDEYAHSDDSRGNGSGATISGGGASATAAADGSATLVFPASGKFLVTATKGGAVRGSAWITIDPATPAAPLKRVNRFEKCARVYPRKSSKKYKRCIRIVRAKQRAEKSKV